MSDATLKLGGGPEVADRSRGPVVDLERPAGADNLLPWRRRSIATTYLALDSLMLAIAAVASAVVAPFAGLPPVPAGWLIVFSLLVIALVAYFRRYQPRFALHLLDDLRSIVGSTAVAAMGMAFVMVLLTDENQAAEQAIRAWLFATTCLAAGRGGLTLVQIRRRRLGAVGVPTLVVGAGRVGHLVARRLQERPEFGLRPVAFLDPDPRELEDDSGLPVLGVGAEPHDGRLAAALTASVRELGVGRVIMTFFRGPHESQLALLRRCHDLEVSVSLVPRLFEGVTDQTSLERVGGLPLVSVHPSDPRGWQFAVKYALDRVFAALAIVLTSPLMVVAAVGVALTIGRPIMFRQRRVGLDDREFEICKFRTMKSEGVWSEQPELSATLALLERDLAPGGVEHGDRRTRLGRFLRRTSIDELPQLFNVLRGEMSLVGPRPERPQFVPQFNSAVYRYPERHRVKSGITGWAQVHGLRGKTSLSDRVEWDNYYVENWSLWLDLKIVLMTLFVIFGHDVE